MKFNIKRDKDKSQLIIDEEITLELTDGGNDMSRLITTFNNGAMVISACREEYSKEENLKRTKELKQDLIAKGVGFRPSAGGFIENANTPNEVAVEELSFIVPYDKNKMSEEDFFKFAIDLCGKYKQESVLVKLPSYNGGKPFWVNSKGENQQNFEKDFRLAKKEDYYTRPLKHHTPGFTYEFEKEEVEDSNFLARYYNSNKIINNAEYDNEGWKKD